MPIEEDYRSTQSNLRPWQHRNAGADAVIALFPGAIYQGGSGAHLDIAGTRGEAAPQGCDRPAGPLLRSFERPSTCDTNRFSTES